MLIESLDINKIFQNACDSEEIQPQDYTFLNEYHIYQPLRMVRAMADYTKHKYSKHDKQYNDINILNLVSFKPHRVLLQEIAVQFTVYAKINNMDINDRNVYILAIYRSIILSVKPFIASDLEFNKMYENEYSRIKQIYTASFVLENFPKLVKSIVKMQEKKIINEDVNPIELSREIKISKEYNIAIRESIREYTKDKIFEFISTTHSTLMGSNKHTFPLKLRILAPTKERKTLFLVGGPGSGKTSYVKQLKGHSEDISDYVEISTDSYKELLMPPPSVPKLMLGYSQLVQTEASFIKNQALKLAVEKGMHILIDQVSFSRQVLEDEKLQKGIIKVIVMSAQISVALERNQTRGIGGGRFEDTWGILNKHKNTVIEVIENISLLLSVGYKDATVKFQDNSSNDHQNLVEFMEINCTQKKVTIKNNDLLTQFFKNKFLVIPQISTNKLDRLQEICYEKKDEELESAVKEEINNFFDKVRKHGGVVIERVSNVITPKYYAITANVPLLKSSAYELPSAKLETSNAQSKQCKKKHYHPYLSSAN